MLKRSTINGHRAKKDIESYPLEFELIEFVHLEFGTSLNADGVPVTRTHGGLGHLGEQRQHLITIPR